MQFIKVGGKIVNKNQIKYIEKDKIEPRYGSGNTKYTVSIVFQGGDEWHYLEYRFDTEEGRDNSFEELFLLLNE